MIQQSGYSLALDEVLRVRLQRQKLYGDSWKNEKSWVLLAMILQKTGRAEEFIINNKDEKLYESLKDTLIDLTNYSLFLLNNIIEQENKKCHK